MIFIFKTDLIIMVLFRYILFVFIFILSSNTWSALVKIDDEYGNSRYKNYPSELIHNSCSLDDMVALKVYSTKKEFKQDHENVIEKLLAFIYRKGFKNILLSHGLTESDVDYLCKSPNRKIDNLEEEFFIYDYVMKEAIKEGKKWEYLFKNPVSSPLIELACHQREEINLLKFLLRAGINLNYKHKKYDISALCYACCEHSLGNTKEEIKKAFKNQVEVVRLLLDNGANPNLAAAKFSNSIWGIICSTKSQYNIELVNLLLAYGTSVFFDGKAVINCISKENSPAFYDIMLDATSKQS